MNIKIEDVTASFVSEKLPDVAKALRDEGAKAVNAEDMVAIAVKTEREQAEAKVASAKVEGATAERKRIAGIRALAMAGCDDLVVKAIDDGMTEEAFAVAQLNHLKKNGGQIAAKAALESAEQLAAGAGAGSTTDGSKPKISPRQQAAADAQALRDKGYIV